MLPIIFVWLIRPNSHANWVLADLWRSRELSLSDDIDKMSYLSGGTSKCEKQEACRCRASPLGEGSTRRWRYLWELQRMRHRMCPATCWCHPPGQCQKGASTHSFLQAEERWTVAGRSRLHRNKTDMQIWSRHCCESNCYSGEGNNSLRIAVAERIRDTIHYSSERMTQFSASWKSCERCC